MKELAALRELREVSQVEEDCVFRIPRDENLNRVEFHNRSAELQVGAVAGLPGWGQCRSDSNAASYSSSCTPMPPARGAGASVWVLDTGIRTTHEQFGGRAFWVSSYISGENADGNGHGTHCAGTIGGIDAGYATSANLYAIKVLSDLGSGSTSGIVSAINYVVANKKPGFNIISMSLGGGASTTLNNACNNADSAGVLVVAAAGNDGLDAKNTSPCSAAQTLCVGATDSTNAMASYSNYGTTVDVAAPGSSIKSAWSTADNAYNTISGTSMATPAVAGQAAIWYSLNAAGNAASFRSYIASYATKNAITNAGSRPINGNWICYDRWNK